MALGYVRANLAEGVNTEFSPLPQKLRLEKLRQWVKDSYPR